jgi:uncharacterized protein
MTDLSFAALVVILASVTQGVIGFGAGLISMSLLAMIWPMATATAVMNPVGVILSLSLAWSQWRSVNFRSIFPLLIGLPVGIFVGVLLLDILPNHQLRALLGCTLIITVIHRLSGSAVRRVLPLSIGALVGFCSGVIGASLNTAGPPALIYASLSGWKKDEFRANLAIFFFTSSFIAFLGLSYQGVVQLETLKVSGLLIPLVLIGSRLGLSLGHHLSQRYFSWITLLCLTVLALHFISATIE